ncbi:MAG: ABC transporter substrate-binding protein [Thermodesulfobacteriota bacterium]
MKRISCFCLCCFVLLAAAQLQAGIVITDDADREVEIPDQVNRLVTAFKPATLLVLSLGGADALVGVDSSSRHDPLNLAVAPDLKKAVGVGSKSQDISLETVISLKPDLVILYSQKTGIQLAVRLQDSGCPAVVIAPETFDSIEKNLMLLGKALDRQEQAARVVQAMHNVQETVHSRVQDLENEERKIVYYAGPSGFLSTAPSGMLQDVMIDRAGGRNAASGLHGYFKQVSPEQLMDWAPDSIILSRMIRPQAKTLLKRKQFSLLPAVKNNNIHVFPSPLAPWDFPSPLSALGVLWLGTRLYPERFADISLMQEVNAFHRTLFGQSFTEMNGFLDDDLPGEHPVGHTHLSDQDRGDLSP